MPHLEKLLFYVIVINDCQSLVLPKAATFTLSYFFCPRDVVLLSSKQYAGRAIVITAKMSTCRKKSCFLVVVGLNPPP